MRPSKDNTFMDIAYVMSKRSTCNRREVGCVIVDKDNYILSTGYNGTPKGMKHCDELGCSHNAVSGAALHTCNALHAEQNAIARLKEPMNAVKLYCTTKPCDSCLKLILATSIRHIVYAEEYASNETLIQLSGLILEKYNATNI